MFRAKFSYKATVTKLRQVAVIMLNATPQLLQVVGVGALGLIRSDFEVKSRGGTGVDGTTWKDVTEETKERKRKKGRGSSTAHQINVDRGLLRNSSQPGFSHAEGGNIFDQSNTEDEASVTVGFGMEYAGYVDEVRELIPDPWPDVWLAELNEITEEAIDTILAEGLK